MNLKKEIVDMMIKGNRLVVMMSRCVSVVVFFVSVVMMSFIGETWANPTEKKEISQQVTSKEKLVEIPCSSTLVSAVSQYMVAWQKNDYGTMFDMEWFGAHKEVTLPIYLRQYDPTFKIEKWTMTSCKADPEKGDGIFRVLVLAEHLPSGKAATFLPKGHKVRSTLIQWWRKGDGKTNTPFYTHIYKTAKEKMKGW